MRKLMTALAFCSFGLLPFACDVHVDDDRSGYDPVYDSDRDGLTDDEEAYDVGTNPRAFDTDSDGLGDGEEWLDYGTDPLDWDTDRDGYSDGDEVYHGDDPLHW